MASTRVSSPVTRIVVYCPKKSFLPLQGLFQESHLGSGHNIYLCYTDKKKSIVYGL
jgi:hypothetical protein